MKKPSAAIDIGSHTARLLIAEVSEASKSIDSLVRRRTYIRLAHKFDHPGKRIINADALDRTLDALEGFLHDIKAYPVGSIDAVATGVVRDASNRDEFLDRILLQTGIRVRLISGEEEAHLTAKGVLHGLGVQTDPFLIFDLGGGSTEFFFENMGIQVSRSIPFGAAGLTNRHLRSDPPEAVEIASLSNSIENNLYHLDFDLPQDNENFFVAGTGGTVTTLALMHKEIPARDAIIERLDGLQLERQWIETLFDKIKTMDIEKRLRLPGLDSGRARIIVAGCLVVIKILHFVKANKLTVSLSDLLEGILLNQFEGEHHE